ncbi:MAG TPA: AAA family ATPase [Polyangiaceae bacterium]|nr:AAA family ATPase [Polyangiaceae bacterium]
MPLFGRAEHLAIASRAFEAMQAGRGRALVVTGEAGIGKSALARSVASEAEARGARVGFGRAWEVGGAPAFWPWARALDELGLDLDELLGNASGEMAGAQRLVAFDRVVRAVCPADGAPVVVILDDLHAADVASVELALAFARAVARKRALLLVTTRESELLARRELGELLGKLAREGDAIPLRRLDPSDTATWLACAGFQGDAGEVHRLTEGNPLFIEEAVRLGVDGFATAAAGGVAVVLAEHLARISPRTRELLAVASVLGRDVSLADVAALAPASPDDVEAAVREGHQAGVISRVARGAFSFAHVLLRDALYASLAPSRREPLHARAAERIEANGGPAALVVEHLLAAGVATDADRVVRTVLRAAEAEVGRHAADSAVALITSARGRLLGRLSETTTLMLDLADVDARMSVAPSDELRARCADCGARAKALGLGVEQARAALTYGRELLAGRIDDSMVRLLEEALEALPPAERALRAQVLARLASALAPPRQDATFERCTRYAREALALARELDHVPTLLYALLWSFHALIYIIPLRERVDLLSELASLAREHGADVVLANLTFYPLSLLESGRPVAARHAAEEYCRLVESLPLPALKWKATALRGLLLGIDGRLDEAWRVIDELREPAKTAQAMAGAWSLSALALVTCTGDKQRLRAVEHELIPILKSRTFLNPWVACAYAVLGEKKEALSYLAPPEQLTRGPTGILVQAQAAIFLESRELAEAYYEPLAKSAPFARFFWGGGAFPFGPVSRILGELALLRGDRARAREHFDTAIAECREMEAVPFLKLAEEARARLGDSTAPRQPSKRETNVGVAIAREGDVWAVTPSTGAPFRVKHAKGMDYLDHLLKNPGKEIYVLVLGGAGEGPEDAGAVLDERAKLAYKRRVEELQDRIDEAEELGDRGRAARAREELEAVAEELAAAVGLGGRDRKAASNVDRARVNVQRRLKDAVRRISEHDAALGGYLEATVRTGTYCVYRPLT